MKLKTKQTSTTYHGKGIGQNLLTIQCKQFGEKNDILKTYKTIRRFEKRSYEKLFIFKHFSFKI